MELTEKERLMLVEKKTEIRKLAEDIIELTTDLKNNKTEIKKKIEGILSLISVIASYTKSSLDMQPFATMVQCIFYMMEREPILCKTTTTYLEFFCSVANSMVFNFTRGGFKVNIQKIDLSIFKMGE